MPRSPPTKRSKAGPLSVQVNRQKYAAQPQRSSAASDLSNGTSSGGTSPRHYDTVKGTNEKMLPLVEHSQKEAAGHDLDVKQIMRDLKHLQVSKKRDRVFFALYVVCLA